MHIEWHVVTAEYSYRWRNVWYVAIKLANSNILRARQKSSDKIKLPKRKMPKNTEETNSHCTNNVRAVFVIVGIVWKRRMQTI